MVSEEPSEEKIRGEKRDVYLGYATNKMVSF